MTFAVGQKITYRDGMTGKVLYVGPTTVLTVCDQTNDGWMHDRVDGTCPLLMHDDETNRYRDADIQMWKAT